MLVEHHEYHGTARSIRRYLVKVRRAAPTLFLRLQTRAGKEAQVDYAQAPMVMVDGQLKRSWFLKMTLYHSRHSYEKVVLRQDEGSFIRLPKRQRPEDRIDQRAHPFGARADGAVHRGQALFPRP